MKFGRTNKWSGYNETYGLLSSNTVNYWRLLSSSPGIVKKVVNVQDKRQKLRAKISRCGFWWWRVQGSDRKNLGIGRSCNFAQLLVDTTSQQTIKYYCSIMSWIIKWEKQQRQLKKKLTAKQNMSGREKRWHYAASIDGFVRRKPLRLTSSGRWQRCSDSGSGLFW